ncbi:TolB family protein, partial [Rhizobium leguminosarum]|uniref:TolB family protein n=1 Tax=Rhizobium leguminosarum TaxID=384 RepID=UPI003F9B311C
GDDANPVWAPQGDCLAFDSTRDGTRQLYVQLRTGEERKLTFEGNNWSPEWESMRNIDDSYFGAADPGSGGGISCTKSGTAGNDVLIGGPGND